MYIYIYTHNPELFWLELLYTSACSLPSDAMIQELTSKARSSAIFVAKPSEASSGVEKLIETIEVPLGCVWYNLGLLSSQVETKTSYQKWVARNLARDLRRMVSKEEFHMDIICLNELGTIGGSLEKALMKWMPHERDDPSTERKPRKPIIEKMLLSLLENPNEWQAYAMAHYCVLTKRSTVELLEEPVLVGLHAPQPARVGMKLKVAPRVENAVNPVEGTELWNVHSPSSGNLNLGKEARKARR